MGYTSTDPLPDGTGASQGWSRLAGGGCPEEPVEHVTGDTLDERIARGEAVRPLRRAGVEDLARAAPEGRHHGVAAHHPLAGFRRVGRAVRPREHVPRLRRDEARVVLVLGL